MRCGDGPGFQISLENSDGLGTRNWSGRAKSDRTTFPTVTQAGSKKSLDSPVRGGSIREIVLKIGEFSVLTQVSIKTLRYYDEVGLLKPARVDLDSGYRYYSAGQVPRLQRILALKDLGFPLDGIAKAIDDGVTVDALRAC